MNNTVFIPVSDEMLENALQDGHPQLIPYAYQEHCYRGLLENTTTEQLTPQSAAHFSARRFGKN